jgi:hypothetical protein
MKAIVAALTPFVDVGVIAPSVNVIAGVVVEVATDPLTPFAVVTETLVTVPDPLEAGPIQVVPFDRHQCSFVPPPVVQSVAVVPSLTGI